MGWIDGGMGMNAMGGTWGGANDMKSESGDATGVANVSQSDRPTGKPGSHMVHSGLEECFAGSEQYCDHPGKFWSAKGGTCEIVRSHHGCKTKRPDRIPFFNITADSDEPAVYVTPDYQVLQDVELYAILPDEQLIVQLRACVVFAQGNDPHWVPLGNGWIFKNSLILRFCVERKFSRLGMFFSQGMTLMDDGTLRDQRTVTSLFLCLHH